MSTNMATRRGPSTDPGAVSPARFRHGHGRAHKRVLGPRTRGQGRNPGAHPGPCRNRDGAPAGAASRVPPPHLGLSPPAAEIRALRSARKALVKEGNWKDVALLDIIGQGACWPPARCSIMDGGVNAECQFCRQGVEGTLRHQAWQCPSILQGIGEDREEARHLEALALRAELSEAACRDSWSQGIPPPDCEAFWCRGILPQAGTGHLSDLLTAPQAEPVARGRAAPAGELRLTPSLGPLVIVGSDGSGGAHGSDTRLRRVGWSWVALSADGITLGSVHGGISNELPQTVPRAELHAAIHFLRHVILSDGVQVELHIDNSYVVSSFHNLAAGWRPAARTTHGDLWADLLEHARGLGYVVSGRVQVHKIKSHVTLSEALARGHSKLAWQANRQADALADEAARMSAYTDGDIAVVCKLDAVAKLVVRRLIAVVRFVVANRAPLARQERRSTVPLRRRVQEAGNRSGHMLHFSAGVGCKSCRQHTRMRPALTGWVVQQCPGPGTQHGHCMRTIRGLSFCVVCGHWAITTGRGGSSRGLNKTCTGRATKRGRELLARLECQPPKLPDLHGRRVWPDGTPADPPTALAAAGRKRRVVGVPSPPPPPILNSRIQAVFDRIRARQSSTGSLSEHSPG
jgi:ribonuclease HI